MKANTSSREMVSKGGIVVEPSRGRTPRRKLHAGRPMGNGRSLSASSRDITLRRGDEAHRSECSAVWDTRSSDEMFSLVSASDVPSDCNLIPLPPSMASTPRYEKDNKFLEVGEMLLRGMKRIIIEAPAGSGKSRKCPNVILDYMWQRGYRKPLLVLTSATSDVVGMHEACEFSSIYKLSERSYSNVTSECRCVYASTRWATRRFESER